MSDWEEAVQNLFRTHPRSISSKTVIEAINSARKSPTILTLTPRDLASEQNRSWNLGHERGVADERERIIKLLEDNNKCTGGLSFGNCTCTALALIKGEQK
jgi:PIN domain nuclease of toxin-antitoxin system